MTSKSILTALVALWISAPGLRAQTPVGAEERQLIAVLQTDHSLQEKDAACARLKRIGTDACIPALAALLADEQLSHSARYALEAMPSPKAQEALVAALSNTGGTIRVGVINSLGARGEETAAPALIGLLADPDSTTVAASAEALGRMGGAKEAEALRQVLPTSTALTRAALDDALLRCAVSLSALGQTEAAQKIYQDLYSMEKLEAVRVASYRGVIETSATPLTLMEAAITGGDSASQLAALQLVHEIHASGATRAFASLLPDLPPILQIALIGGLAQRGDSAAVPVLLLLAQGTNAEVRQASLGALGELRDADAVPVLVQTLAHGSVAEKKAARAALLDLRPEGATEALLNEVPGAPPEVQMELGRLLGERGDASAVPRLFKFAHADSATVRAASLPALGMLADGSSIPALVQMTDASQDEEGRDQAAAALDAVCQRIQSKGGRVDAPSLARALTDGSVETRVALLPVAGDLMDETSRQILRKAVREPEPRIREAGLRALCGTRDAALLPDLLRVAHETAPGNFKLLAIRGCVRLMTQEEGVHLDNVKRIAGFKSMLESSLNADEKRAILAGLAALPDPEALDLIMPFLEDPAVSKEAIRAVLQIAPTLPGASAADAVEKALGKTDEAETRQAGQQVLQQLRANTAAGPQNK